MNFTKKPLIATAVVFIMTFMLSYLIHQVILGADYDAMKIFRPANQVSAPVLALSYLIAAVAFVQIYLKGQEDLAPLSQGIRFGLIMALFAIVPMYLMNYAVLPFTPIAIIKGIVCDSLALVLAGITVAHLLKK